jgi:hypothetical protein
MKSSTTRYIAVVGAFAALLSGPASAQPGGTHALSGGPAPDNARVNKVIRIDSNTRWVNVTEDDTVRFVVGGPGAEKSFVWSFVTPLNAVKLGDIAPPGTIDRLIHVYIAREPHKQVD